MDILEDRVVGLHSIFSFNLCQYSLSDSVDCSSSHSRISSGMDTFTVVSAETVDNNYYYLRDKESPFHE